jgi:hypothetical protein
MSDPVDRVENDAEQEAPQAGAAPIVDLRPRLPWKSALAIGLVITGTIGSILWITLLIFVVYLVLTR